MTVISQFLSISVSLLSITLSHSRIRNLVVSQKYSQQSYRRHDRTVTGLGLSQSLNSISELCNLQSAAQCSPQAHLQMMPCRSCSRCRHFHTAVKLLQIMTGIHNRSWQAWWEDRAGDDWTGLDSDSDR